MTSVEQAKQFAEENSHEENLVESIIEFYYKNVRRLLTDLSYPRINIDGLGHMTAKPMIVKKLFKFTFSN